VQDPQRVSDLWRQQDVGKFAGQFHTAFQFHGVVLSKVAPMRGHLPKPLRANQR
jgi:hypothetical protein